MPTHIHVRKVFQAPTTPCAQVIYHVMIIDPDSPHLMQKDKLTREEYHQLMSLLEKAYQYDILESINKST